MSFSIRTSVWQRFASPGIQKTSELVQKIVTAGATGRLGKAALRSNASPFPY